MIHASLALTLAIALPGAAAVPIGGRASFAPEAVIIHSGPVALHALLWRPAGLGPFPAVLLNHGSGRAPEELRRLGPYERQAYLLGPVFVRHGYQLLYLFRRGVGPSQDSGKNAADLMNAETASHGLAARNALQLRLLEGRELGDARAGLAFLRDSPAVDPRNVAVIGHSFGGSLTLLLTEVEPFLRAIVIFSAAGYSWDRSPELRARLLAAEDRASAPIFFIHAANDYSTKPGETLDARLQELGKTHRLKIYPPVGRTAEDGHDMLYRAVEQWEPDVFEFLDQQMRR